jgi:hypothetical protein
MSTTVSAEQARSAQWAVIGLAAVSAGGGFAVALSSVSVGLIGLALAAALVNGMGSLASP